MSRKSVLGAFCAHNGALEAASRSIARAGQQRTFSSTPQRKAKHVPIFTKTSSPELDDLLGSIRNKIILPSFLPQEQRKKLFRQRYEKKLESDPIIIEVDGEIFKFRHMDPQKGNMPNTRKSVIQAIQAFSKDEDFANLVPLLEGIYHAKRKLPEDFYAKIARELGKKGRVYDVIECARMIKRTGYKLDTSEKVNTVLADVQMKAIDAGWSKGQTEQSLRWTEMVLDIIEEEEHQPRVKADLPLNRDPQVLLAPLHLATVLVAKHEADEQMVAKMNKYAREVVRLWPEGTKLRELHVAESYVEGGPMHYLMEPNKFVSLAAPLLFGLEMAVDTVKDAQLADELRSKCAVLGGEIQTARQENKAVRPEGGRAEGVWAKLYSA
ncbi:uncharacterized protein BCR38DRAFT_333436 [Pseudomassariella vexata]|uniref:Uncharacterized protein n=1 Tax=Pseudomassariella vexata TaxID=1141098 RepID=A0A1Y2ED94_9PEZI|nr:uncharacterized protein BCR38DRAFT_333436 [Pseudomassariella vexata]ORY69553.1 hypothetical protein BCR38DRAFT_333436 [Pseudomassariella vexata]